jgi:hypothetical protein
MIRSIRHKGLKRLYEDDDLRGVIVEHAEKLRDILARLDAAGGVSDFGLAGVPSALTQRRVHRILGSDRSRELASDFSLRRPHSLGR